MRWLAVALIGLGSAACTDVATNPNAVVAVRFDGSAYPSIVAGDSLRDSLGAIQPLQGVGLNYKNEPVPDAVLLFSSPDTILRVFESGVVFARGPKADGIPTRVFATVQALQSQPDSLYVVPRGDSIAPKSAIVTPPTGATIVLDTGLVFNVLASGNGGAAATAAPFWLVSFQLRLHDRFLSPFDTTMAYTFTGDPFTQRVKSFIDTTSTTGSASRSIAVLCSALAPGPDSVIVIATIRNRLFGSLPKSAQTVVRLQRGTCP